MVVNKDGSLGWCNRHNPSVNFNKKNHCSTLRNLTKKNQITSIFKNQDQIETKKN